MTEETLKTTLVRKRFHCSLCFNIVTRIVLIDDGAYDQAPVFCVGVRHDHKPNQMTEMLVLAGNVATR